MKKCHQKFHKLYWIWRKLVEQILLNALYMYIYIYVICLSNYLSIYISYSWSRAKDLPISDLQTQPVVINQNICRVDSGIIIDIIITENVLGRPVKYCRKKIGPQVKLLQTIALTSFSIQKHLKLIKKYKGEKETRDTKYVC